MIFLKILKKIYSRFTNTEKLLQECIQEPDIASDLIYQMIKSNKPLMIARFGAFELATVVNYLGITNKNKSFAKYIKGQEPDWIWNQKTINFLNSNAGFFPPKEQEVEKFCQLMMEDSKYVDILGSWLADEKFIEPYIKCKKVQLLLLEPYTSKSPWSRALKDKKVLVVHPFKNTIEKQYKNRELLFENKDTLPKFQTLTVIRAIQSIGGNNNFKDWFEALEYMKSEIDKVDYDICLIAAGAYGFPLAAHVKRKGQQSIHMGGALQLLFGIKGKRWENLDYGKEEEFIENDFYIKLLNNNNWVRPNEAEKPSLATNVEDGCYW